MEFSPKVKRKLAKTTIETAVRGGWIDELREAMPPRTYTVQVEHKPQPRRTITVQVERG